MVQDPYKVLDLPEGASKDEIKRAYRKKAKEYHPDLHPNDPVAAQKMNEVNEAYDMLMNPEKYAQRRAQQERQQQQRQSAQQQNTYGGYQGPGGWYSDFGGFDFGDIFGFGSFYSSQPIRPQYAPEDSDAIRQVVDAINQGRYPLAIDMLSAIPSTQRNARWYFLNALANHGAGNTVQALEQIQQACRLEPENTSYRQLYQQLSRTAQTYQQNGQRYQSSAMQMQRLCTGICATYICCTYGRFCC